MIFLTRNDAWEMVATLEDCVPVVIAAGLLALAVLVEDAVALLLGELLEDGGR